MRANKLFLVLFLILFSTIALAEITTSVQSRYDLGQQINFAGGCNAANIPVAFQLFVKGAIGTTTIWFDQANTNVLSQYTKTYTPSGKGNYTLFIACGGESKSVNFCVGAATECPSGETGDDGDDGDTGNTGDTQTPTGGGGSNFCSSSWSCSTWSLCNASLVQARSCYDTKNCKPNKVETRSCPQCEESWVCSLWSTCKNDVQARNCYDQHTCGTTFKKPLLQKNCNQASSGYEPVQISNQLPPPDQLLPEVQQPQSSFKQMWDKYGNYILIGLIGLVIITIIILLIAHFTKPKKMAYNHDELVEWIKQERNMGTSDEDIHNILSQNTGWNKEEIHEAFELLRATPTSPVVQQQ